VADSFAVRFDAVRLLRGPLTWGLDPSGDVLDDWGLGDTPDGLERFIDIVLPVAADTVGIVKPQAAFYERHGWRGIRALTRLIDEARSAGLLVVLDAKRGDVGSTNQAYAEAYLGPDAPMRADALTVHPYLGVAAMGAFIDRAAESGSCLLVVTRSSNMEGRSVQASIDHEGRSVEQSLLDTIRALNAELAPGGIGPVGAVIGPTHMDPRLDLVAPNALYLAPGVGRQGASPDEVASVFSSCPDRVLPSASRSLLTTADPGGLRDHIGELAAEFRRLLGS
jgi:orotidine-5'-phosphate decarboxylase